MEIIIGKTAGFCYGVKNAVDKTFEVLQNTNQKTYCLGELVHNEDVISELKSKGLQIIDNIEQAEGNVIIRAHGIEKETYAKANEMKINLIDLTCPNVLNIHKIAEKYSNQGYFIMLVGASEHPEVIGIKSFCKGHLELIQKQEDLQNAINTFKKSQIKKLLVIVQTTFNTEKFNKIITELKQNITNDELTVKNTICNATSLRQEETRKIASQVDLMIIIGGKNSSNTHKLFEIANQSCKNAILIQNEQDMDLNYIKKFDRIGIMAGASTPQNTIEKVIEVIKK